MMPRFIFLVEQRNENGDMIIITITTTIIIITMIITIIIIIMISQMWSDTSPICMLDYLI